MDNESEYSSEYDYEESGKDYGEGQVDPNREPPKPASSFEWALRTGALANSKLLRHIFFILLPTYDNSHSFVSYSRSASCHHRYNLF
jgi:hypothetical protein